MRKVLMISGMSALPLAAFASNPPVVPNAPAPAPGTPASGGVVNVEKPKRAKADTKPLVVTGVGAKIEGLELPTESARRGSQSGFPFDKLANVGDMFGLKGRDKASISSVVSAKNRKCMVDRPKLDANGNPVMKMGQVSDGNGGFVTVPTGQPETEQVPGKQFKAIDVTKEIATKLKGTDYEGSTVLVTRTI